MISHVTPRASRGFGTRQLLEHDGMKIDVYRSTKNQTRFLSVPAGADPKKMIFPETFDSDLRDVEPYHSGLDIQSGDQRIGLNSAEIIGQINKYGYAVHGALVRMSEKV
jgi:hypothetical protein